MILLLLNETVLRHLIPAFIIFTIFKLLRFIYSNFFRSRVDLINTYGKNSWVMITGSTDGIGKSYAEEFARCGFNIILVSRTLSKLNTVAQEIKSKCFPENSSQKIEVVEYDFNTKTEISDYTSTFNKFLEYDISILVNNVGVATTGAFASTPLEVDYKLINVNIFAQSLLTKIFAAKLEARNNKSAIIDLSSVASTMPIPFTAMYSATKSFNKFLTCGLAYEYKNINFLSHQPLYVATPLFNLQRGKYFFVITPEETVEGALKDLGYALESTGHWKHKVQRWLYSLMPMFLIKMKLKKDRQRKLENEKKKLSNEKKDK